MSEEFRNEGLLHAVKCEWCGIKMSCNCWDGNDHNRGSHIMVLCPRCQVTNFLNLVFGEKDLRWILESKIEQARSARTQQAERPRTQLRIVRAKSEDGVAEGASAES